MLAVLTTVLLSAVFLATTTMKVANETKALDIDGWINTLKQNHPSLARVEQAKDVQEVVTKIKAMDTKEAIKDPLALHILSDQMELKAAQVAQ
jgi:hypothetical protein